MPNWCEGTLKVRGAREDIKKFLLEAFTPIPDGFLGQTPVEKTVEEDEWELIVRAKNGFHVKGTHRNFIECSLTYYYYDEEQPTEVCVLEGYKAAWAIDSGPLALLSQLYNVDLKIYAFEKGMEFNQDIEIHKGQIVKDLEVKFDDYNWECIEPHIGG